MRDYKTWQTILRGPFLMAIFFVLSGLSPWVAHAQDITITFNGSINTPTCIARLTVAGATTLAGNAAVISLPALSNPQVKLARQGAALADRTTFKVDLYNAPNTNCTNPGRFQVGFTAPAANVDTSTLASRAILVARSGGQVGVELSANNSGSNFGAIINIPASLGNLIDSNGWSSQLSMDAAAQNGGSFIFAATPVKLAADNTDITDSSYGGTVNLTINYY
jgi:type 1 fimbria pilin